MQETTFGWAPPQRSVVDGGVTVDEPAVVGRITPP